MDGVILSIVSMMSCTSRKHHEYNARAIVCKGSDEVGIHSTLGGFLAEVEADTGVLGALENLWNMVLEDAGWETELKRAVAHNLGLLYISKELRWDAVMQCGSSFLERFTLISLRIYEPLTAQLNVP